MKIAVIAWGSLLWDKRNLEIQDEWRPNGPILPVEFGRVSADGRLTLVIVPGYPAIQTYWGMSGMETLDSAIQNLMDREGTIKKYIGICSNDSSKANDIERNIDKWRFEMNLDAVIWTALPPKDKNGQQILMPVQNAIAYLSSLKGETKDRAEEYIRRTPEQIITPYRKKFKEMLSL